MSTCCAARARPCRPASRRPYSRCCGRSRAWRRRSTSAPRRRNSVRHRRLLDRARALDDPNQDRRDWLRRWLANDKLDWTRWLYDVVARERGAAVEVPPEPPPPPPALARELVGVITLDY